MSTPRPTDADLLGRVREGDADAFAELRARHVVATRRLATSYRRAGPPDDLVEGAFERALAEVARGIAPAHAFRTYLFVSLRRLAARRLARSRGDPVDEVPPTMRPPGPDDDDAERHGARGASVEGQGDVPLPSGDPGAPGTVLAAYEGLPERWQLLLWQSAVEGRQPGELAPTFGMSPNAAAALVYRGREKLRQSYLEAHLDAEPHPECEPHRTRLVAYLRDGLGRADRSATEAHVEACPTCPRLLDQLRAIDRLLVQAVQPYFLEADADAD